MQLQPTFGKPPLYRCFQPFGLCFANAVTNHIISKAFERNMRTVLLHPHVERIVQKEICQQRADYSTLSAVKRYPK
jgi:hypothetical protein